MCLYSFWAPPCGLIVLWSNNGQIWIITVRFLKLAILYLYAPICGKRLICIQLKIQFSWCHIHLHTAILFLNPSTILVLYPRYLSKKSQQNVHHPNSFKYSWSPCDLKDGEISRRMVIRDLEDLGVPRAHDLGNLHMPMHPMLLSEKMCLLWSIMSIYVKGMSGLDFYQSFLNTEVSPMRDGHLPSISMYFLLNLRFMNPYLRYFMMALEGPNVFPWWPKWPG